MQKHWDTVYEERLKMATDPSAFSDLAVVVSTIFGNKAR